MDEALQDISLTAAVMMITAASPHNIELTQIHLQYHLSSFLFISMLENLLLLLTVALAETIPLLSVSMSSLSSIVLPSPAWLLVIHRYSTVHCFEGGFVDSLLLARGQVESYAIGEQKYHRYSTLPTLLNPSFFSFLL